MAFIDNLRMSGIFGGKKPFGMPDMSLGDTNPDQISSILNRMTPYVQNSKRNDQDFQVKMFNMQRQAHLDDIAKNIAMAKGAQENKPMNQVMGFDSKATPRIAAGTSPLELAMKERELALKESTAKTKADDVDADRNIRQQRADTYSGMHDISDSEKLDIVNKARSGDLVARAKLAQILQGTKGDQTMEQIGARQAGAEKIQGMRNEGSLEGIAANIAGKKEIETMKQNDNSMLPTQTRVDQQNKARQLAATRPDLAQFVDYDDSNGAFNIQKPDKNWWGKVTGPNAAQQKEIEEFIFGKSGVANPVSTTTPSATPTGPIDKTEEARKLVEENRRKASGTSKYAVTISGDKK